MTLEEYLGDWCKVMDVKMAKDILKKVIRTKETLCPKPKDVFKAFELCPLSNLRILVLAQDPYNNLVDNQPVATGIAFANRKGTLEFALSPSLKVLRDSLIDFTLPYGNINFDTSLEKWEEQGVLMVNSALTCLAGKAGSHTLTWMPFMKALLANLSKHTTGMVYVLMGSNAQCFEPFISKDFNHIIKTRHPAWHARTNTPFPRDLWKEINTILIGQNGYGIRWYENND